MYCLFFVCGFEFDRFLSTVSSPRADMYAGAAATFVCWSAVDVCENNVNVCALACVMQCFIRCVYVCVCVVCAVVVCVRVCRRPVPRVLYVCGVTVCS